MIYETAVVVRSDLDEDSVKSIKDVVNKVIGEHDGEALVNDDWGVKTFAQPTTRGVTKGHYFYVMYRTDSAQCNQELERRLGLDERILKKLIVKLGPAKHQEALVKTYRKPGTQDGDKSKFDLDKDRKLHAKKKSCWFTASKTCPDWKDPSTYSWLVNEFGKISPARITGLRPKFQRKATEAIKRGRCLGLISYMSSRTAR